MKVKEIMKKAVATEKDMSVEKARELMTNRHLSSLIFVNKGEIKGIITEEDILKSIHSKKQISQIMSKKVITVDPEEKIEEAARIMRDNKISILPVKEKKGLVGIISAGDLLSVMDEGGEFIIE